MKQLTIIGLILTYAAAIYAANHREYPDISPPLLEQQAINILHSTIADNDLSQAQASSSLLEANRLQHKKVANILLSLPKAIKPNAVSITKALVLRVCGGIIISSEDLSQLPEDIKPSNALVNRSIWRLLIAQKRLPASIRSNDNIIKHLEREAMRMNIDEFMHLLRPLLPFSAAK